MTHTPWHRRLALAATALALSAGLVACGGGRNADIDAAQTSSGLVRGSETDQHVAFKGIPYAAPPVGALRWKAPTAPAAWSGERSARAFGPHCAQPQSFYGTASTSEDCLYLNVYRPKSEGPHPVMVWIHGGAFYLGESNGYNPERLVAKDTVVVTLNYRLGALGFLAHPALSAEQGGGSGNYGLMDQQAALRWVKANIAALGGDPANVTIFGESAGGFSVMSHLASPGSAGLFHKAIVMSGAYPFSFGQDTLAQAEAKGSAFAATADCSGGALAACLRSMPVSAVLAAQTATFPQGPIPHVDKTVLPAAVRDTIVARNHHKVPVLQGTTRDEWRLFVAQGELLTGAPVTEATYVPTIMATLLFPQQLATTMATAVYPPAAYGGSASLALGALGTDAVFACSGRVAAKLLSAAAPVYSYEFADASAPQRLPGTLSFPMGAAHTSELPYLFTMNTLNTAQQSLADTMAGFWTSFARSGNPNAAGSSTWPAYTATGDQYLSLAPNAVAVNASFNAQHKCSTVWTPGI